MPRTRTLRRAARPLVALGAATALVAGAALGAAPAAVGPPAVCLPIAIGDATTIEWNESRAGETVATDPTVALARALAVVAESDDALVVGETLRRAALISEGVEDGRRPARRAALVAGLEARLDLLEAAARAAGEETAESRREIALALLAHAHAQAIWHQLGAREEFGAGELARARALELAPDDGRLAYVAALGAWDRQVPWELLRAALGAAADDPLLAENLAAAGQRFFSLDGLDALEARLARELGAR